MLSPMSLPRKSLDLGVVLGPLTQSATTILNPSPGAAHIGDLSVGKMRGMAV